MVIFAKIFDPFWRTTFLESRIHYWFTLLKHVVEWIVSFWKSLFEPHAGQRKFEVRHIENGSKRSKWIKERSCITTGEMIISYLKWIIFVFKSPRVFSLSIEMDQNSSVESVWFTCSKYWFLVQRIKNVLKWLFENLFIMDQSYFWANRLIFCLKT